MTWPAGVLFVLAITLAVLDFGAIALISGLVGLLFINPFPD